MEQKNTIQYENSIIIFALLIVIGLILLLVSAIKDSRVRISEHYRQTNDPQWQFRNLDQGMTEARKQKKYVFVMYSEPSWCLPCQMMERQTLPNKKIRDFMKKHYIFVRLKPQGKYYPKRGIPDYIWINPHTKKVVKISPKLGYMDVEVFYKIISTSIKEKK